MALTKALGAAFLYLRSFWQTEASLHYETAEDRSSPEDFSEIAEGQSLAEDFSEMADGQSFPEEFTEMAEGRCLPEDFSEMVEVRSLPEDLIVKILVKLPVKSLLRCRCVCKTWSYLIKSPDFVKMHLDYQKSNDNFLILCNRKDELRSVISLHSFESPGFRLPHLDLLPVRFCGSCDGLVCLLNWQKNVLILCNPATREFRLLPRYPFRGSNDGLRYLTGAVGLGLASITNDYKVIVIVTRINFRSLMYEVKALVYSLSTNAWRKITCNTPLTMSIDWDVRGTLFGGAVHWIDWERDTIISFNVNTEMFSDVELPHIDQYEGSERQLIVFNGSLGLLTYENPSESQSINVWVMDKYGVKESWTKQLTVGPMMGYFYPVLLLKSEAIILDDPEGKPGLVSVGNHETNSFDIQGIQGPVEEVMAYSESLISIN